MYLSWYYTYFLSRFIFSKSSLFQVCLPKKENRREGKKKENHIRELHDFFFSGEGIIILRKCEKKKKSPFDQNTYEELLGT